MRNFPLFFKFLTFLIFLIILFTYVFRYLKLNIEGEDYTLFASFYWVLTTMTTLGYGDIIFNSDFGRIFSIVVLIFGVFLVFIALPYFFISFIIGPWIEESVKHRIPHKVPDNIRGHAIICDDDPIALTLAEKLESDDHPYYIVVHDINKAETLFDDKISVLFGDVFEEETYSRLNISTASMVFANQDATKNAHIAITVRQVSDIPIAALIEDENTRYVLKNAGCTHILPVKALLGESISNKTMAGTLKSSVVGKFDKFDIVKIPVYSTPFQGKTISSLKIKENTNVKILGVLERTDFLPPEPNIVLSKHSILILMGEEDELLELNSCLSIYRPINKPIIIIGGGAVGLAMAKDLTRKKVPYILIDKDDVNLDKDDVNYELGKGAFLKGDARQPGVLETAGISTSPCVAITTNNDGVNNYLTIYCRLLNKDICIICRANNEKNLSSMYKAGADFVVPYNMIGSNMVYNLLHKRNLILRTEGLSAFEYKVSKILAGKTLSKSRIRELTRCNVFCLRRDGKNIYDIKDSTILKLNDILCVIGTTEQELIFFNTFKSKKKYKKSKMIRKGFRKGFS